jgi:hypothetical protein
MPRFAVLYHDLPPNSPRGSHYDFMLEQQGALRTWALDAAPDSRAEQEATALADHRLAYLTYEGAVSGDRGTVTQWDAGVYELECASENEVRCLLRGRRLQGTVQLQREPQAGDQRWRFRFKNK